MLYRLFTAVGVLLIAVCALANPDTFFVWYVVSLRSLSLASWIPSALLLALFLFGATQCLAVGNLGAAALLSAVGLVFPAVKFGAIVRS